MSAFAHVDGHPALAITVHVPGIGPWWADVVLEGAPDLSGSVRIGIGELELVGTVDPDHAGTHGLQRRMRVVAGGGGWRALLRARHYHNDAQVRARTVAEDAAREAGETLGDFAPASSQIGSAYVRQAGTASRVLEDVIGSTPWWVGYDGATTVGERAIAEAAAGSYEVLEHVPDERLVVLGVDDPRAVAIGSVLSRGLDAPVTVRELEIEVTGSDVRVKAWGGGEAAARGRLAAALLRVARRVGERRLHGVYRYRVTRLVDENGERVELQRAAVVPGLDADPELPDLLPVVHWPGIAGAHAQATLGSEVLVQFIEGDRRFPVATHAAGKTGNGWAPAQLTFDASSQIRLGAGAGDPVALSTPTNERLDDIAAALDALCSPLPIANDGGAALQTAVKAVWPGRTAAAIPPGPPTAAADVGATKVLAE